jgi:hypothetical protein
MGPYQAVPRKLARCASRAPRDKAALRTGPRSGGAHRPASVRPERFSGLSIPRTLALVLMLKTLPTNNGICLVSLPPTLSRWRTFRKVVLRACQKPAAPRSRNRPPGAIRSRLLDGRQRTIRSRTRSFGAHRTPLRGTPAKPRRAVRAHRATTGTVGSGHFRSPHSAEVLTQTAFFEILPL